MNIALGDQHGFSWQGVAAAVVGVGLTRGIGTGLGLKPGNIDGVDYLKGSGSAWGGYDPNSNTARGMAVGDAAVRSVVSEGIESTLYSRSFEWANVANGFAGNLGGNLGALNNQARQAQQTTTAAEQSLNQREQAANGLSQPAAYDPAQRPVLTEHSLLPVETGPGLTFSVFEGGRSATPIALTADIERNNLSPDQQATYDILRTAKADHQSAMQATQQLDAVAPTVDSAANAAERKQVYDLLINRGGTEKAAAVVADGVALRQRIDALEPRIAELAGTDPAAAAELQGLRSLATYALTAMDSYFDFDQSIPQLLPAGVQRRDLAGVVDAKTLREYQKSGYAPALYHDSKTNGYILANRGSESWKDWRANITQPLGFHAAQFEQAVDLAYALASDKTYSKNLVFTGHSLGGGLAAAQTLATGRPSVTFNAEGLSKATVKRLGLNPQYENRITNHRTPGDALSLVQNSWAVDALAAYYLTPAKNAWALSGLASDLLTGREPDLHGFGIAYVPEAMGEQKTLSSPGMFWQHGMNAVMKSLSYTLDATGTPRFP